MSKLCDKAIETIEFFLSNECKYKYISLSKHNMNVIYKVYKRSNNEIASLEDQLKQSEKVIDKIYDYIKDIINNPVKYATKNNVEAIFKIIQRYKGDSK